MKPTTLKTAKIYWEYTLKHKGSFLLVLIPVSLGSLAEMIKPIFYKSFFDLLGSNNATVNNLMQIILWVLLLSLLSWVMWRTGTFATTYHQTRIMKDLSELSFENIHQHSYKFFSNNFGGSLVRKVNKLVRSYEIISDQFFWSLLPIAVRLISTFIILSVVSKLLGLIVLIWSALFISFNYYFALYKIKYDMQRAEADTMITAVLADTITNNVNIKLFNGYEKENQDFKKTTKDWYKINIFSWSLTNYGEAIQSMLMFLLEFAVFYIAIKYWEQGRLSIGDFTMLQAYLLYTFSRLWDLGKNIRRIYESFADAAEMTEILNTPFGVQDIPKAKTLAVTNGKIEIQNANFAYSSSQNSILKNFSLSINPGEKVAIVGPSGGGKSTIVKLMLRFYDLNSGKILIDEQNIAEVTQDSLRKNLSMVPQDPILFHRSLMENIRYGRPEATDKEVLEASKLAHCHEFILNLSKKYNTLVGERGIKLSGGERQRVAIARAILKNAPVLVLDEATSSLDSESEMLIQDALKNLMRNKTTIVIAHRLSTIMQMDRILVLENGQITEEGKHKELLKMKEGTYQKLWGIQAGGFT